MGRHARALSDRGYLVTGIDRDTKAIAVAREAGGGPQYEIVDVRDYEPSTDAFDAAIVMGQSFGHFDETTNRDVLQRLGCRVRKGGRFVLDIWSPEFFRAHRDARELATSRGVVYETKRVDADRLYVDLRYPNGAQERFEWQMFTPEQMARLADSVGFVLLASCSGFDLANAPSSADPRIQFLLERPP